jgi:hypothetical protein
MSAKTIRKPDFKSIRKMTIRKLDSPVLDGSLYLKTGQNGGQNHSKTGFQKCPRNDYSNTGQSDTRWVTVFENRTQIVSKNDQFKTGQCSFRMFTVLSLWANLSVKILSFVTK